MTKVNEFEEKYTNLKKELKKLRILLFSVLTICAFFIFIAFNPINKEGKKYFDELTVGTLNIAGPDSVKRIILTHLIGDAPFQGKKVERTVPPKTAGIIYLNPNGDEIGGVGFTGSEDLTFALNALDYTGIPLEAIGYRRIQTDEIQSAEFVVLDNPRKNIQIDVDLLVEQINSGNYDGTEIKKLQEQMVNRISLGVKNHNASLVLSDSNGNSRIILEVDDENNAVIKLLDEEGNVVQKFPEG